jgi:hypothetical protein
MGTKYITNTFKKLDTDTSVNKQDPSSFCDAVDLRLISDEALSNGALVNFKGTKAKVDLGALYQVKGYTTINDTLILLLYHPAATTPAPIDEHSIIATVELSDVPATDQAFLQSIVPVYTDISSSSKLNFGDVDVISCVGRYESSYSKKVYFAVGDEITPLRSFNVVQTGALTHEAYLLDIIPNNTNPVFSTMTIIDGGNLQAGKIQYSCRLFKKYGAETAFSPTTGMISLTSSGPKGAVEFTGSDIETSVSKSISLIITDLDTNYDYANLYSIFYAERGTPIISKVAELEIPASGIVSIVDNGTVLERLTIEEFNTFGGRLFSAETIAVKNNMLFAANLTEASEDIDIDCRAYRFNSMAEAQIFEADGSYYDMNASGEWSYSGGGSSVDDWDIPAGADCINKYNDEFLQPADEDPSALAHPHPYIYDKNVVGAIGGTGPIVSYTIGIGDKIPMSDALGNTVVSIGDGNGYTYVTQSTSRKRGETYREGITFYDKKGRPFFTKWIGDIRIPYTDSFSINTGVTLASAMIITYRIDLSNVDPLILARISGFHMSSVERTTSDQSIVCQGATWMTAVDETFNTNSPPMLHKAMPLLVNASTGYTNTYDWEVVGSKGNWDDARKPFIHPIYSPDLYYNGGIDSLDETYRAKLVDIYRYKRKVFTGGASPITMTVEAIDNVNNYSSSGLIFPSEKILINISSVATVGTACTSYLGESFTVVDSMKMTRKEFDNAPYIINYGAGSDQTEFYNRVLPYNANTAGSGDAYNHMTMFGPTCGLISTKVDMAVFAGGNYVFVLDLYRDNASVRYGGNTYEARALNNYHPNSLFVQYEAATAYENIPSWGDSYNTIFDCFTSYHDPNRSDMATIVNSNVTGVLTLRQQVVALIPIESKINCTLASLKPSKYIFNLKYASGKNSADTNVGLQETTTQGVTLYGSPYPVHLKDTIAYNTVYSQPPVYPLLVVEPTLFEPVTSMPATIIASEVKSNGEFVDNWTKFLYNNIIDVDSSYGAIHNLQHFNNKLYFFQEDGIGVTSVNERYIMNQDKPSQLALGIGGILERYDYIKYNEGISDQRHIIATNDSIYFLDTNRRVLTDINSDTVPLSVLHGVNSLVRTLIDSANDEFAFGYNPIYKEVLFTIGSKTLVFNEHIDVFSPRHSYIPSIYLNLPNGLYSFLKSIPQPATFSVLPASTIVSATTGIGASVAVDSDYDWSIINSYTPPVSTPEDPTFIFKHDVGEYGEVYSELGVLRSISSVSFIVNPGNTSVNVFDTLDFRTDISPTDDKTITNLVFENSYQLTYKNIISKTSVNSNPDIAKAVSTKPNTSRRMRAWTTSVPLIADSVTGKSKRVADTWLKITMNFQNDGSQKFRLHDVITYYREANKSR